jgi:hypothetical protein
MNLPLGYLRAGVKKFSVRWFIAVHAAIPLVVLLRIVMGVGWQLATFPLFAGAYVLGHFLGGEYRGWRRRMGRL